jgi:hypothetical protein
MMSPGSYALPCAPWLLPLVPTLTAAEAFGIGRAYTDIFLPFLRFLLAPTSDIGQRVIGLTCLLAFSRRY